jgi:hypothetical protein
MDRQQLPNPPETQTRRHSINVDTQLNTPRFDLVLPSYRRDRRVSSITTTIPLETVIGEGSTRNSIPNSEQNASSLETADDRKGIKN